MLVYNLADTWFVGQTKDNAQVAAVTVSFSLFIMLNALANLFGVGGGSLISRLLGRHEYKLAGKVASFLLWGGGFLHLFIRHRFCFFGAGFFLFWAQIPQYSHLHTSIFFGQ